MTGQPQCPRCSGLGIRQIAAVTVPYLWQGQIKLASILPIAAPCGCAFQRQMDIEAGRPRLA